MTEETLKALRTAVADYIKSEGCDCCQNREAHEDAARRLAGLLNVPMYSDASGYNFNRFATDPTRFDGDQVEEVK
jgi:hypothetical protein